MRYFNYLINEGVVQQALGLDEPETGKNYPSEKVKRYIELINKALEAMKSKEENDTNDAIVQDLRDKKKKWSNVKSETKPKKTKLEVPPDQQQQEEPPPEQAPPPEEKQPKESKLVKALKDKDTRNLKKKL